MIILHIVCGIIEILVSVCSIISTEIGIISLIIIRAEISILTWWLKMWIEITPRIPKITEALTLIVAVTNWVELLKSVIVNITPATIRGL